MLYIDIIDTQDIGMADDNSARSMVVYKLDGFERHCSRYEEEGSLALGIDEIQIDHVSQLAREAEEIWTWQCLKVVIRARWEPTVRRIGLADRRG